ncbi:hypothetical protein SAY87_009262 [Trapa incisa]|uniref:Uncharacterized protein n=1 Tax=Trapa incisa TaxID=236973 RepID=A0AAN7JUR3_9MYRT|nr:hypothetical protein SAY87_009262 [Trapa incisa]
MDMHALPVEAINGSGLPNYIFNALCSSGLSNLPPQVFFLYGNFTRLSKRKREQVHIPSCELGKEAHVIQDTPLNNLQDRCISSVSMFQDQYTFMIVLNLEAFQTYKSNSQLLVVGEEVSKEG